MISIRTWRWCIVIGVLPMISANPFGIYFGWRSKWYQAPKNEWGNFGYSGRFSPQYNREWWKVLWDRYPIRTAPERINPS